MRTGGFFGKKIKYHVSAMGHGGIGEKIMREEYVRWDTI